MIKVWNPRLGIGDLDYRPTDCSFAPEKGEAIHFRWTRAKTGLPGKMPPRRTKAQREAMREWDEWLTFTTREGEVLTFRRNGPPPERRHTLARQVGEPSHRGECEKCGRDNVSEDEECQVETSDE